MHFLSLNKVFTIVLVLFVSRMNCASAKEEIKWPLGVKMAEQSYERLAAKLNQNYEKERHKIDQIYLKDMLEAREKLISQLESEFEKVMKRADVNDLTLVNSLKEKIDLLKRENDRQKNGLTTKRPESSSYRLSSRKKGFLKYELYYGKWNKLPDFNTLKAVKRGTCTSFDFSFSPRKDYFAVRFTGYIYIDQQNTYLFDLKSDDGSKLLIDGQVVVNNDGTHSFYARQGKASLKKGYHKVEILYFEARVDHLLELNMAAIGEKLKSVSFKRFAI